MKFGGVREVLKDVEELKRTGVSCPRVTDVSHALEKRGLYTGPAAVTVADAEKIVKGVCRR